MTHQSIVRGIWDDEAEVWVAASDDIQGLAIEAETLELLKKKVVSALQDLIELNGLNSDLQEIPVTIKSKQYAKVLNIQN